MPFLKGGRHLWTHFSQSFSDKNEEFLCSSERKFPEVFKTHPTFVSNPLLMPSMAHLMTYLSVLADLLTCDELWEFWLTLNELIFHKVEIFFYSFSCSHVKVSLSTPVWWIHSRKYLRDLSLPSLAISHLSSLFDQSGDMKLTILLLSSTGVQNCKKLRKFFRLEILVLLTINHHWDLEHLSRQQVSPWPDHLLTIYPITTLTE